MLVTNPCSDKARGKGFGEIGMADCLYIRYQPWPSEWHDGNEWKPKAECQALVLWIEWKKLDAKGNPTKATQKQKDWHLAERKRGGLTLIAGEDFEATIEGFVEWYNRSGLAGIRRRK